MKVYSLESFDINGVKVNESKNKLIIEIAAIHNDTTKNLTHYTAKALQDSIEKWIKPYEKKVLKNHDIKSEPLGRIISARYGLDEKTNKNCVFLTAEIVDEDAIKKILDKRYTTVSVGGYSEDVVCSICNQNIAKEGFCGHVKGEFYDENLCFWILNDFDPEEISFVNSPADENAMIVSVDNQEPEIFPTITFSNENENNKVHVEEEKGKDGEEINKMDLSTQGKTNFAHRLLHMWWKNPSKTNWTREQIKKEHARVVRAMFNKYGMNHNIVDGLDETLPEDLKKRSKKD